MTYCTGQTTGHTGCKDYMMESGEGQNLEKNLENDTCVCKPEGNDSVTRTEPIRIVLSEPLSSLTAMAAVLAGPGDGSP